MKDKELLQMLEVLGKNSRIRSFAASDVVEGEMKEREDQLCAATIRKIVGNSNFNSDNNRRSFAAAADTAAIPSPNRNINRAKVLYNFVIKNHKF